MKKENNNGKITYCETCGAQTNMVINFLGKEKVVPIICDCRKKEIEKEKIMEDQKILNQRIDLLISQGIMDKEFSIYKCRYDNDKKTNP